jgi:serine/threonine protein kinase
MEYLPSSFHNFNISYRNSAKYLSLSYVKLFGYQTFTGLHYLHTKCNITHRDLKPRNIFVDPNSGELKICDFGSAKRLLPGQQSQSYVSSRYYRAQS